MSDLEDKIPEAEEIISDAEDVDTSDDSDFDELDAEIEEQLDDSEDDSVEEDSDEELDDSVDVEDEAEVTQPDGGADAEDKSEEENTPSEKPVQLEDPNKELVAQEAFKRREAERKLREEQKARRQEHLDNYVKDAGDDEVERERRTLDVERLTLAQERSETIDMQLDAGLQKTLSDPKVLKLLKGDDGTIASQLEKAVNLFVATQVVTDQMGHKTKVKSDVYQYLINEFDSIAKLAGLGARAQTKDKAKQQQRTVIRPTRAPKQPDKDPMDEGFDEEANRW